MESTKVMEEDIKTKTTLYDRIKEEYDRLAEQFRVRFHRRNETYIDLLGSID